MKRAKEGGGERGEGETTEMMRSRDGITHFLYAFSYHD